MSTPAHRTGPNRTPRKEAFHVRIVLPDGSTQFVPATDYIGREMPYDKPRETCAVRVYDDVVAFSLLHISKRRAATLQGKTIAMPSGMLTRLARRSSELESVAPGFLVVEREEDVYTFKLDVDDNRVATVEWTGEGTEPAVELDPRGERLSIYLVSPLRPVVLALAFIGHLGKPGTPETVGRCAAKVLNAALGLATFQTLADIETVVVPSRPGSLVATPQLRSTHVELPVQLFTDPADGAGPAPVGAGTVVVQVDLEHAPSDREGLLFSVHPDESLAEVFDPYREICRAFVQDRIREILGDELRSIALDIAIGDVDDSTSDRVRETLQAGMVGVDLTPTKRRPHQSADAAPAMAPAAPAPVAPVVEVPAAPVAAPVAPAPVAPVPVAPAPAPVPGMPAAGPGPVAPVPPVPPAPAGS